MSMNGSFNTSDYKNRYLTFEWSVKSQNVADNTTTISWSLKGAGDETTSSYYTQNIKVIIDGETVFNKPKAEGQVVLRNGTVVTSGAFTFTHKDDGTHSFEAYVEAGIYVWEVNCTGSGTFELPQIARASTILSAADTILGDYCNTKWAPMASTFWYKLVFSLGNWKIESEAINPGSTEIYTYKALLPLGVAAYLTDSQEGSAEVVLYTYLDKETEELIGTASATTFKVTVPNNGDTQPIPGMTLTPVSTLSPEFDNLYVQGLTKVDVDFAGVGKYGSAVKSCSMTVEGKTYNAPYTSDYLTQTGDVTVRGSATDSRGITGTETKIIPVIPYAKPKINVIECGRCDKDGNLADDGTYLKIKAKRVYSKVQDGNGVQHNFCQIRYRYAAEGGSFSNWSTILSAESETDEVETAALLGGVLSTENTFIVQVGVADTVGSQMNAAHTLLSESVFMHRRAGGKGAGFGKYCEEDDLLDVAWNARIRKKLRLLEKGDPVADFVTETGTKSGWEYIRRSGGLVEAWHRKPLGSIALTTQVAEGVYSNESCTDVQVTLPDGLFKERILFTSANAESSGYLLCQIASHNITDSTLTYRIWSPYSVTANDIELTIYCVGRSEQPKEEK